LILFATKERAMIGFWRQACCPEIMKNGQLVQESIVLVRNCAQ